MDNASARAEYDAAMAAWLADFNRYQQEVQASRQLGGERVSVTPQDPALKDRLKQAKERLQGAGAP